MRKIFGILAAVLAGVAFALSGITATSPAAATTCFTDITPAGVSAGEHVIQFTQGSCSWTVPDGVTHVHALVIAGGGGGGADCVGGGGGAGGVIDSANFAVSGAIQVNVGAGGMGGSFLGSCGGTQPTNGANTTFGTLTATGGGGGGNYLSFVNGADGGSGGGGGGVVGLGGAGVPNQGFAGGAGASIPGANPGGGGGGATAAGGTSTDGTGGVGGAGFTSNITGTSVVYAGGGGGGSDARGGVGGAACAGNGSSGVSPATSATGFGCGGGGADGTNNGGNGSPGVVIVRYTAAPLLAKVQGFAFESAALSPSLKLAVAKLLISHSETNSISCTGFVGYNSNHRSPSYLRKLALTRANAVCKFAKSLKPSLTVGASGYRVVTSRSSETRRVLITINR